MIYISATDDSIDGFVKRVCAPLFATTQFVHGGHDESATSATVTFVRFESRIYAVTCHHVVSAFFSEAVTTGHRIIPTTHSGRTIHQFGSYGPNGTCRWSFRSCRDFPAAADVRNQEVLAALDRANADKPDIAIADLTDIWASFSAARGADVVDLDAWTEPNWSSAQPIWMAYGFPNDHKYRTGDKVAAPMPRVSAELASTFPSAEKPTYILCSTLPTDHGWGFSGLSGGPALVAHASEDRYAFVGVTFEGAPSSKDLKENAEAFVGRSDIVLRGYHLTPMQFKTWLSQRQYEIELGDMLPRSLAGV
jgi:hypothetical protein